MIHIRASCRSRSTYLSEPLGIIIHSEEVRIIKFSWDGEFIAVAGYDRCIDIVRLWSCIGNRAPLTVPLVVRSDVGRHR